MSRSREENGRGPKKNRQGLGGSCEQDNARRKTGGSLDRRKEEGAGEEMLMAVGSGWDKAGGEMVTGGAVKKDGNFDGAEFVEDNLMKGFEGLK